MRYRFSDLKRTTGGVGHPPFKADMLGYDNYYPFGMMPEDRRATALTGGDRSVRVQREGDGQ